MVKSKQLDFTIILILTALVFLSEILVSSAISFIAGSIILLLIINKMRFLNPEYIKVILPLLLILCIGIIGSLFHLRFSAPDFIYLVAKDFWYYTKPVIYFFAGVYIFRIKIEKELIISVMIYLSLVIAIQHIVRFTGFYLSANEDQFVLDTVRVKTSFVSIIQAFSLSWLIVLYDKSGFKSSKLLPRWLMITILSISLILSFSRTLIISFILSVLAMKGFFSLNSFIFIKSTIKILLLALFLLLSLLVINKISHKDTLVHSFTEKYLNTFRENTFQGKYTDYSMIHNWRGYETHLTRLEIRKGGFPERLFGYGFGKTVFIGNKGFLGEGLENIPKFHNGFIEIILKTGYAGLILYLFFFYYLFRLASRSGQQFSWQKLFIAIIITAFVSTFVITGLYNKSALDSSCILLGYFSGAMFHSISEFKNE